MSAQAKVSAGRAPARSASAPRSLAGVELFEDLSPSQLTSLVADCAWHRCAESQEVFGQETDNADVFFVIGGRVRVTIFSSSGQEIAFRDLGPGASFGEMSAIDGLKRSASVLALQDSVLASMSRAKFRQVMRAHPAVAERVMLSLAALVRSLTLRVVEFSTLAVQNRVQAELVRMAREAGVEANQALLLPIPRHADIASRVATNREAVARELNRLARAGVVERRRGSLVVLDVARLVRMVDEVTKT